jgi:hypothetical protein
VVFVVAEDDATHLWAQRSVELPVPVSLFDPEMVSGTKLGFVAKPFPTQGWLWKLLQPALHHGLPPPVQPPTPM